MKIVIAVSAHPTGSVRQHPSVQMIEIAPIRQSLTVIRQRGSAMSAQMVVIASPEAVPIILATHLPVVKRTRIARIARHLTVTLLTISVMSV
jgi:hypothetical protein